VSKAFLPDDAPQPEVAPPRREGTLPVTPRGFRELAAARAASAEAGNQHSVQRLDEVLATVQIHEAIVDAQGGAGFGCSVELEDEDGQRRRYDLIGPDEIDAARGRITLASPLGKRLSGVRPGDVVEVERKGTSSELTVLSVSRIT
jgi:transcription elongation GreA/GreB family factor